MLECNRFKKYGKSLSVSGADGVVYLKLRKNGSDRPEAMNYCTKQNCRQDSTQIIDGPSKNRTLRLQHDPTITDNGWHYLGKNYYLGKKEFTSTKQIIKKDKFDLSLQEHFDKNEANIKNDFKKKIQNLNVYFKEINKKFKLKSNSKRELMEKVSFLLK